MKLLTISSMLAICVLALSTLSVVGDGQVRRRNGHVRLLEKVVWDPQERLLLEEPLLIPEMGWVDFAMEASMSLSMSLSMSMMLHPSTKTSKSQGPKGDYHGKGSTGPIVTHSMGGMDGSHADESIPEVASDVDDHKVWVKRSHVQDDHDSMKLVKT